MFLPCIRMNRIREQCAEQEADEEENLAEKSSTVTYDEAQEQAQESIDLFLREIKAYPFQYLVADLLNAMGLPCHLGCASWKGWVILSCCAAAPRNEISNFGRRIVLSGMHHSQYLHFSLFYLIHQKIWSVGNLQLPCAGNATRASPGWKKTKAFTRFPDTPRKHLRGLHARFFLQPYELPVYVLKSQPQPENFLSGINAPARESLFYFPR